MKKSVLALITLCATVLLFSNCEQKTAKNEYLIQGVTGDPALQQIYLLYTANDSARIDSVTVENGQFTFKGVIDEPLRATLSRTDKPQRGSDFARFYMEAGKITINITDSLKNATFISPINNEREKWKEASKSIREEMEALTEKWRNLPKEESEAQDSILNAQYEELTKQEKEKALDFIKTNPDSYYALAELYSTVVGYNPDGEKAQEVFDLFSEKVTSSELGIKTAENIAKLKAIAIGNVAPDFTQNDTDGKPVSLSSFRGKYVLIDFWASWCGPCRAENPNVVKAFNLYKDRNFTILGVSLDNSGENWLKAIADDKLDWTHVSDLGGWKNEVSVLYAVRAIPANFLIDPEGKIVERNLRGTDLTSALEKYLK